MAPTKKIIFALISLTAILKAMPTRDYQREGFDLLLRQDDASSTPQQIPDSDPAENNKNQEDSNDEEENVISDIANDNQESEDTEDTEDTEDLDNQNTSPGEINNSSVDPDQPILGEEGQPPAEIVPALANLDSNQDEDNNSDQQGGGNVEGSGEDVGEDVGEDSGGDIGIVADDGDEIDHDNPITISQSIDNRTPATGGKGRLPVVEFSNNFDTPTGDNNDDELDQAPVDEAATTKPKNNKTKPRRKQRMFNKELQNNWVINKFI